MLIDTKKLLRLKCKLKSAKVPAIVVAAVALVLLALSSVAQAACPLPVVVKGVADLNCLSATGSVPLVGSWSFSHRETPSSQPFEGFIEVPGYWRNEDPPLSTMGFGVYRVKLIFDGRQTRMGLRLPLISVARRVSIIGENGLELVVYDSGYIDGAACWNHIFSSQFSTLDPKVAGDFGGAPFIAWLTPAYPINDGTSTSLW